MFSSAKIISVRRRELTEYSSTLVVKRDKTDRRKKKMKYVTNTKFGVVFNGTAFAKLSKSESRAFQRCDVCWVGRSQLGGNLLACGACHKARYCSPACQKVGWDAGHKKVCKELRTAKCNTSKKQFTSSLLNYMATFGVLGRQNTFQRMRKDYTAFRVVEFPTHYVCHALETVQSEHAGCADFVTGGVTWHIPLDL